MIKAIGLFSGGLDSMLAVCLLRKQKIDVAAVTFVTPFFNAEKAVASARHINATHHVIDITQTYIPMLKNPRYGYGRCMNPCIDCHGLMFKTLGEMMQEMNADFLFSGEVVGQRPMSQNRNSLKLVEKISGYGNCILRPLSALVLPETDMEKNGLVDRAQLLGLNGRSRKPQMELAHAFNITRYPEPAGGCKLTEPGFSRRLKDLLDHEKNPSTGAYELLNIGRHFRISSSVKFIAGRNRADNIRLMKLKNDTDIVVKTETVPGALLLIQGSPDSDTLKKAASVCLRYSDVERDTPWPVTVYRAGGKTVVEETPCTEELIKQWML